MEKPKSLSDGELDDEIEAMEDLLIVVDSDPEGVSADTVGRLHQRLRDLRTERRERNLKRNWR